MTTPRGAHTCTSRSKAQENSSCGADGIVMRIALGRLASLLLDPLLIDTAIDTFVSSRDRPSVATLLAIMAKPMEVADPRGPAGENRQ